MRNLIIIFFTLVPCLLYAQEHKEDTTHIYHLPEVTITEKYQIRDIKSAIPTQSFSQQQIQMLNAFQLSDAVKHFSGVTVKDYGGIGGLKTISIRSFSAEHTTICYDGIAITDAQTGQIDIGRYSIENIDRISLSIGQNSSIFQPARLLASAGVLNISTQVPSFHKSTFSHGFASMKMGSWGLINPFIRIEQKINKQWAVVSNIEWTLANGKYPFHLYYTNQEKNLYTREKRNNTEVNNSRMEFEIFGNFNDKEQFRLKTYYYYSSRGLPGATTYYYNRSSQHLWDKNFFVQSHYQKEFNACWAFQTSAKWNWSYEHYLNPDYKNDEGKTENNYFQQEYYITSSLLYRAYKNLSISFSTDESLNRLNADLYEFSFPTRFSWLSATAMKYINSHFVVSSSLLSTTTKERVHYGNAGKNYHRLSPFASLLIYPIENKNITMRLFYKNIFRLPTFNDLYYSSIGNANLKPEETYQFNIGTTYSRQSDGPFTLLTASIDAYYNKVNNKIVAIPTKNLFVWSITNLGKVIIKGIDLNSSLSITPYQKWYIDLSGNYSYVRALDMTDPNGKTYKQQIAYTPRVSGSGQCTIHSPWVTLSYAYVFSGKRYILGQNISSNRLNGYSDSSISARRSFSLNNMTWSIGIELLNLMNKNYEIVKNFPMPGRSFRINISAKL